MVKETIKLLEIYGHPHSEAIFHLSVTDRGIGDKKIALKYLEKYYLSDEEYLQKWKVIQNSIFQNEEIGLPAKVFRDGFSLLAIRGGILFDKEDFEYLKNCIKEIGDSYMIIIQNDFGGIVEEPLFKMKYPANITWNELISGDFISTALFEMSKNEYFVFSESGSWGKYSANDYDFPLDIIGFKPELGNVFREQFKQSKEEKEEIQEWLPPKYKKLIK